MVEGEVWWESIIKEFVMGLYTLLYLKWIVNKDLLYSTCNSAQCYLAAWMGGQFRREWISVYVCLSPFAVPIQNKKFKYIYTYIYILKYNQSQSQTVMVSKCPPL